MKSKTVDYRSVGVDIKAGERVVEWLKKKGPISPHVVSGIGGFSGLFKANFPSMKEPCLSASTDGVGTKVKLAVHFNKYKGIGQDLVAMCVNDVICSGAKPLFFMDYYAVGQLKLKALQAFLTGVQTACEKSHCVLLGGETAEMPDCYRGGDFDCAGFAVGVVDKAHILGANRVQVGDKLLGVSSSGFHSNGFSLLRKVFSQDLDKWEKSLIKPTALYVDLALSLFKLKKNLRPVSKKGALRAMAHITGGGLDNILRVLPHGMGAKIKPWRIPVIFREVQKRANLSDQELLKTLNCGIGLVLVIDPDFFNPVGDLIKAKGFKAIDLGWVVDQKKPLPTWFF